MGDYSKCKYLFTFVKLEEFLLNLKDIQQTEWLNCEISIFTGKEEERIRKIIGDNQ
jgi:hypothetical protein